MILINDYIILTLLCTALCSHACAISVPDSGAVVVTGGHTNGHGHSRVELYTEVSTYLYIYISTYLPAVHARTTLPHKLDTAIPK